MNNEVKIKIEGMSCDHCRQTAEKALNAIEGVEASVSLENAEATVKLDKDVDISVLEDAISACGFKATAE